MVAIRMVPVAIVCGLVGCSGVQREEADAGLPSLSTLGDPDSDDTGDTGGDDEADQAPTSYDVGDGSQACETDDPCCMPGQLPPHALLDAFLSAYPPALMPKTRPDIEVFAPVADGHAMSWSDENVGGELVDAGNGGVIEANVDTGRSISRMTAEDAMPAGATVISTRDEPVMIEDLGGGGNCIGVGWAWGSVLFESPDGAIGELVYLYIGYCRESDMETFYYSESPVEVCAAPG